MKVIDLEKKTKKQLVMWLVDPNHSEKLLDSIFYSFMEGDTIVVDTFNIGIFFGIISHPNISRKVIDLLIDYKPVDFIWAGILRNPNLAPKDLMKMYSKVRHLHLDEDNEENDYIPFIVSLSGHPATPAWMRAEIDTKYGRGSAKADTNNMLLQKLDFSSKSRVPILLNLVPTQSKEYRSTCNKP
jgi:hypothetical protein